MKTFRKHIQWIVISTVLLISMVACLFSPQTTPTENGAPTNIPPTVTATEVPVIISSTPTAIFDSNTSFLSTPTQTSTNCLPENEFFPAPEELENYIGWQYNYQKKVDGSWGGTLIILDEQEYGLSIFEIKDNSFVLVFEKLLCRDDAGHAAWEIIDVLRTRPIAENEHADLGTLCKKNGERASNYRFVFMDKSNNGKVYLAWSIDENNKIVEASIDGLWCIIDGLP